MASGRDDSFLEESPRSSKQDTPRRYSRSASSESNGIPRSTDTDSSEYSQTVSKPSKAKARSEGVSKKTCSLTQPLSSSVPRSSNYNSIDRTLELQISGQFEEEPSTECCDVFYNCYRRFVVKLRHSPFMYILLLLFASIPVSATAMGFIFMTNCPKLVFLPSLGAIVGMLGIIFMLLWTVITTLNCRGKACSAKQKFALVIFISLLSLLSALDGILVICLFPNYDHDSKDYCNETFHKYSFCKEMATIAVVVLSAIIYFPGSRHAVCCRHCLSNTQSIGYFGV